MTKTLEREVTRAIRLKREQLASIREEVEDLFDYLDVLEARARDRCKPKWSHAEVKRRYGLK